eukprot:292370-Hanusia_phi.AAC.2
MLRREQTMPDWSQHDVEMTAKSPTKRRSMEVTRENFQNVLRMRKGTTADIASPGKNALPEHLRDEIPAMADSSFVEIVDVSDGEGLSAGRGGHYPRDKAEPAVLYVSDQQMGLARSVSNHGAVSPGRHLPCPLQLVMLVSLGIKLENSGPSPILPCPNASRKWQEYPFELRALEAILFTVFNW